MAFRGSGNEWQPVTAYAYETIWRPLEQHQDFHPGLGLTAGITLRELALSACYHLLPLGSAG